MNAFREALTPLAQRLPRIAREHEILRFAADLPVDGNSTNAVVIARQQILQWAQKRSGGVFPAAAFAGESFEHLAAGRNSAALRLQTTDLDVWAIRQDDPDKQVPGRIWTTEAVVWNTKDDIAHVAGRLLVGTSEAQIDIAPAVPGFAMQLVEHCGILSAGQPVLSTAWYIDSQGDQDALLDLLVDPSRRLPIVVITTIDENDTRTLVDPAVLARALTGLAFVVAILPATSWEITQRFDKRRSVFGGAARVFMPGFDEDSDAYAHPLLLAASLNTVEKAALGERRIREIVSQFSLRAVRLGEHLIPFSRLRSLALEAKQEVLTTEGAADEDQLAASNERIASLEVELREAKEIESLAIEELAMAEERARLAEAQSANAAARVQQLLQQLKERGIDPDDSAQLPEQWGSFVDWCDEQLVGRVVLTGAARRGCKKAIFGNVQLVARCMLWLATECRSRFMEGGGSLRDEALESGIRNAPCGNDAFDSSWMSGKIKIDWHIKTGGNSRAPENCLRIYYGWDDTTQQIIVADMPAHRTTGAS